MNRLMILAAATTMFGVGELTHEMFANPPVDLQPTTPGTVQSGNVNVNGTVLAGTVYASTAGTSAKAVSGWATSSTGFVFGGDFRSTSVSGRGVFGSATAATGATFGGDFRSASVSGRGVFGSATAATGATFGGDFRSDSNAGTGILGRAISTTGPTTGGLFTTASNQGVGVQATSTNTSGATYAAVFDSYTTGDIASTGIFRANGASGGVVALRAAVTASGDGSAMAINANGRNGYGGYFLANGTGGWGAYGEGNFYGLRGHSSTGTGAFGDSGNKDNTGVWGYTTPGGTGNAVFANGSFAASGTKSLKIDHPDDPENKYLLQYCAEGDTPQLQYRGVVKLDAGGNATVALPSYFDKINRDPSYQLTPIGAPMPNLYVAQKVTKNEFKIAGGKPRAEVSWTVIGVRNDRFVQQYGAKTEMDKADQNKGTYLMPELYNKPKQLREGYSVKDDAEIDHRQPVASAKPRSAQPAATTRTR